MLHGVLNATNLNSGHFLRQWPKNWGGIATIATISSTHLTFLESGVTKGASLTPKEVRQLAAELCQCLDNLGFGSDRQVLIDPKEPLIWKGGRPRKLALNISDTSGSLGSERQAIIDFLAARNIGKGTGLKAFDPHVTIGSVDPNAISEETLEISSISGYFNLEESDDFIPYDTPGVFSHGVRGRPMDYLAGLAVPGEVTLNGLMVYTNQFDKP